MGILFYCMAFLGHQVSTIYRMNNLIIFKLLILLTLSALLRLLLEVKVKVFCFNIFMQSIRSERSFECE